MIFSGFEKTFSKVSLSLVVFSGGLSFILRENTAQPLSIRNFFI